MFRLTPYNIYIYIYIKEKKHTISKIERINYSRYGTNVMRSTSTSTSAVRTWYGNVLIVHRGIAASSGSALEE